MDRRLAWISRQTVARLAGQFLALVLFPTSAVSAQLLSGVVVDELTARPISAAAVSVLQEAGRYVVATAEDGSFRIQLSSDDPVQLYVSALGYLDAFEEIEPEAFGSPLRIELHQSAIGLEGIEASVEREDNTWKMGPYFVTDGGLIWPPEECQWLMSDSVVVKNNEWLKPEVWQQYEQATRWMGPKTVSHRHGVRREYISDPRVLADAWPCGVYITTYQRNNRLFTDRPAPPEPEGLGVSVVAESVLRLPLLAAGPEVLSVSSNGVTAFVAADGTVHAVESDGTLRWSLPAEPDTAGAPVTPQIGWLGDTVWIAEGAERRTTKIFPDGSAERRYDREGLPAQRTWRTSERTMPVSPTALDLAMPVPAADGFWFWTIPAPDPPTPPIHPDDPPGRLMLVLTDEWRMHRILAALRPGLKQVDVVLGPAPVLGAQPFRDHPIVVRDPNGRHVTVVEREHQMLAWLTSYRVTRYDLNGDTLFFAERRGLMSRVSDEVLEGHAAELADLPGARGAFPDDAALEDPAGPRRTLIGGMLYQPPFLPSISQVAVGFDGTTWLRWPDAMEPMIRWEVLDQAGVAKWTFELDRRLRIVAADGNRVWATQRDRATGETLLYTMVVEIAEPEGLGR